MKNFTYLCKNNIFAMKYVFVTAYDDFSDYSLLEKIYNKLFSNINKDELTFYCTVGSSGDNTCAKYIRRHGMKMIDWLNPRKGKTIKEERKNILVQCNYAVIINNGYHKGMFTAADQARKYVNGNVAIVHTDLQEILKSSRATNSVKTYGYNNNGFYEKEKN